jgi:hypothetical protein
MLPHAIVDDFIFGSKKEGEGLLKHLKKDHVSTESMSLADIYNIDIELIKVDNKSKIGF